MDESPPKLTHDQILFNALAKKMPFFAFVFSIFLYLSVFYKFNLSPSKLFNNSKFWFFISNTLIIILALDYSVFSSSSEHNRYDLYQEYVMRRQKTLPSYISRTIIPEEEVEHFHDTEIVPYDNIINSEKGLAIEPEKPRTSLDLPEKWLLRPPEHKNIPNDDEGISGQEARQRSGTNYEENKKVEVRTMQRSKSDGSKKVMFDESRNIIRRVETEKFERSSDKSEAGEKVDDYENMSNEELNKRVEDFIQRFNRQIRLEKAVEDNRS
ncbi:hypothetical protein K2173_006554 [Erythroxylum novogranatense]|uniref:DUF4408 domain-containing protein n=1 Tax=Erythroxylum novogranatense TaxID=1862640 RepID=A0AAV8T596_9ROSI|nr:hypothetical protein K2173_006554 [Erythroxylum novogranatense]